MPAHLAAYLVFVWLIAWSRPPGRLALAGLVVTGLVVLVSFVWNGPIVILGVVGLVVSVPAGVAALIVLVLLMRGRRVAGSEPDELAHALLWTGLLIALPATFVGAYVNGAGLFCF